MNLQCYDGEYFTKLNLDENECRINSEDLRLISGRLFLSCDSLLIPLKKISYREKETFVTPEVVIPLPCPECGGWYILGFDHNCNGVLK